MASPAIAHVEELTISEISALISRKPADDARIPEEFVVSEAFRPSIAPNELLPSSELPVVELGPAIWGSGGDFCAKGSRTSVVTALTKAAKDWGFVQVVNHGVPLELLERMASLGRDFFALPGEQKEAGAGLSFLDGYSGKPRMVKGVGSMWIEGITFKVVPTPSVEVFANNVWSGGNPEFCDTVYKVRKELEQLKNTVLQLLAEGLGLPTAFFTQHFEEGQKFLSDIRANYYPACAQPSLALGTAPHTDPTMMTVLYQDRGYGLQILAKDRNTWHLVDHKADGLIIFINDALQAWSNGVLEAAIHRVVLNQQESRLSFLLSSIPPFDLLIQPANVGGEARYKPFFFRDYVTATAEYGHLPPENGRRGIDIFAGIPLS